MNSPEISVDKRDIDPGTAVRLGGVAWRTSSFCESSACVEAAPRDDGMAVRDTDDPDKVLEFDREAWGGFIDALNAGEL